MNKGISSSLGYPRIGENREWKKGLEAFWAGTIEEKEFLAQMQQSRLQHLQKQKEIGIDLIPVNDFTMYDHMLDMAVMFGYVPKRYEYSGGLVPLSIYFAMARGNQHAVACEMTKWFNTNYHYIVPEFQDIKPVLNRLWTGIVCFTSMIIANLGLNQIIVFSVPILLVIYPLTIVLIIL